MQEFVARVLVSQTILRRCNICAIALKGEDVAVAVEGEAALGELVRLCIAVVASIVRQPSRLVVEIAVRDNRSILSMLMGNLGD